ncbi:hypothetical protein ASD06_17150 [Angustibacter sp. Root456]|nr:hypothetical protein ASD06_17150 [Angustibacter sp. Root456]
MTSNKAATARFRDDVIDYLRRHGHPEAARRPEPKEPTPADRLALPAGSIVLDAPWTILVRNERTMDLSGALTSAAKAAAHDGHQLYGCIQHRRGRSVEDAYVTMPLRVWSAWTNGVIAQAAANAPSSVPCPATPPATAALIRASVAPPHS